MQTKRNEQPTFFDLAVQQRGATNRVLETIAREVDFSEAEARVAATYSHGGRPAKESTRWKDTMLASIKKREALEAAARKYEANTGNHIRPICLVQVERTGKDQRGGNFIHAEDVWEYLVKEYGVAADEVAVKSSEKDDIEGINLFARNCPIRYIITKQALQEGWDCLFAYVLTILTNPSSRNNLTQLVGRILRQPFARKTRIRELDESYVSVSNKRRRCWWTPCARDSGAKAWEIWPARWCWMSGKNLNKARRRLNCANGSKNRRKNLSPQVCHPEGWAMARGQL